MTILSDAVIKAKIAEYNMPDFETDERVVEAVGNIIAIVRVAQDTHTRAETAGEIFGEIDKHKLHAGQISIPAKAYQ